MMAIKNWLRGRGEAAHLSNLDIDQTFLAPGYELRKENLVRGDTRLLEVFSLVPKAEGMPSFRARVDDGSPANGKDLELDIDIMGVSNTVARDFKVGRNGYRGHHTDRSPTPEQRIFDVEIATPDGKVFEGQVSFNATFSLSGHMRATTKVTVDARVTRAGATRSVDS